MGGPLDTMRSLEQFLPGDQPRGFMGPDSGPKGKIVRYNFIHLLAVALKRDFEIFRMSAAIRKFLSRQRYKHTPIICCETPNIFSPKCALCLTQIPLKLKNSGKEAFDLMKISLQERE